MSKVDTQKIIIRWKVVCAWIIALKDGMLAICLLQLLGSLFLIVGQLPFEGVLEKPLLVCWGWLDRTVYAGLFRTLPLWGWFPVFQLIILMLRILAGCRASAGRVVSLFLLSLSTFWNPPYQKRVRLRLQIRWPKVWFGGQGIVGPFSLVWQLAVSIRFSFKSILSSKMPEQGVPQALPSSLAWFQLSLFSLLINGCLLPR